MNIWWSRAVPFALLGSQDDQNLLRGLLVSDLPPGGNLHGWLGFEFEDSDHLNGNVDLLKPVDLLADVGPLPDLDQRKPWQQ